MAESKLKSSYQPVNLVYYFRKKKKIKQYTMARDLGVSPSYLSKIETNSQKPTDRFKKQCAQYLNVPENKLFGLKDPAKSEREIARLRKDLDNRLWTIRRQKGMKQYRLAELLKVSPSYLSKIETGYQDPSPNFMKECARILKVKEEDIFPKIRKRKS